MRKRTTQQQPGNLVKDAGTVIGNGIILENINLKGLGVVRIDGVVTGEIQLEGHLVLGETGKIIGNVKTTTATFYGSYEGNLQVDETLHIAASGHVDGEISTSKLIIEEGAQFHGVCNRNLSKSPNLNSKVVALPKEEPKALEATIEDDLELQIN